MDELDNVLWAYWMMHRVPTEETLINLTYGTEVVSPLEVAFFLPHINNIDLSTT